MLTNASSYPTDQLVQDCSKSQVVHTISTGFITLKAILILPLSSFVLYLGHHRWRQHRSFKTSHSDIFTYHLAVNEMFWSIGLIGYFCGTSSNNRGVFIMGICSLSITFYGEVFFHVLTCVDRYLAVVHPVTYLMLRNTRGVRIRNISIGCVWLLCSGLICFHIDIVSKRIIFSMICVLVVTIVIITFCTISVLCVLIRPGPGEGGRHRVDQSKLRAFHTIAAITTVLWVWFVGLLVCFGVYASSELITQDKCIMSASVTLFNLPTSLVSPLLYLHRAGKLTCSCCNPE